MGGEMMVCKKTEDHPENKHAVGFFAYYDSEPSQEELEEAGQPIDDWFSPYQLDDEVSKRASLQRWFLRDAY